MQKKLQRYWLRKNRIPLILGSATPDINTYYKAINNEIVLLELTKKSEQSKSTEC